MRAAAVQSEVNYRAFWISGDKSAYTTQQRIGLFRGSIRCQARLCFTRRFVFLSVFFFRICFFFFSFCCERVYHASDACVGQQKKKKKKSCHRRQIGSLTLRDVIGLVRYHYYTIIAV